MFYTKKILIYKNEETKTSYYIAGFNKKSNFNTMVFITHSQDILLKGKTYSGVFKKRLNFTEFDIKIYVNKEIKDYTFQKLLADLVILNTPKYVMIFAERPPRPRRIKTKEEMKADEETMMAASFVNLGWL